MVDCKFIIVPIVCIVATLIAFALFAAGPGLSTKVKSQFATNKTKRHVNSSDDPFLKVFTSRHEAGQKLNETRNKSLINILFERIVGGIGGIDGVKRRREISKDDSDFDDGQKSDQNRGTGQTLTSERQLGQQMGQSELEEEKTGEISVTSNKNAQKQFLADQMFIARRRRFLDRQKKESGPGKGDDKSEKKVDLKEEKKDNKKLGKKSEEKTGEKTTTDELKEDEKNRELKAKKKDSVVPGTEKDSGCANRGTEEFHRRNNFPITDWHCYKNANFAALAATVSFMAISIIQQILVILGNCICGDLKCRRTKFITLYVIGIIACFASGVMAIAFGSFVDLTPDGTTKKKEGGMVIGWIAAGTVMLIVMIIDAIMMKFACETPSEIANYHNAQ